MSDPVGPVRRAPRPRRVGARAFLPALRDAEARAGGAASGAAVHGADAPAPAGDNPAAFTAQVMGGPPKRGLRGGPETLDHARNAYLEAEWSGGADRRHPRGRIAKREI